MTSEPGYSQGMFSFDYEAGLSPLFRHFIFHGNINQYYYEIKMQLVALDFLLLN
jgi:hypothetical protein